MTNRGPIGERSVPAFAATKGECRMNHVDKAEELFRAGHACSQAILMAWAPDYGLDAGRAARLAAGFGAGMRVGSVCGAVTGAFMVLGLAVCGQDCVTGEGRTASATANATFAERFRERVGCLDCPGIIGCDLRTAAGKATAQASGLVAAKCAPAVRAAAEILTEMLPGS